MTNKNKSHSTRAEASRKIVYQPPNYLEAPKPNVDGIKYRWIRVAAGGEDDSQNVSKKRREGYEYVRADEHPDFDAPTHETGKYAGVIGTGDLVLALSKLNAKKITGLDISPGMLEIGKEKVSSQKLDTLIDMQLGDSEDLKFSDNSFDAVTVAFGVRNFENLNKGLSEIYRVLRSNGTLVILETAVPKNYFIKPCYSLYTQNIMPFIGKLFSKDKSAYKYLSDSAAAFPCGEAFNNILRDNGFKEVEDLPQTLGIASIYFAKKK